MKGAVINHYATTGKDFGRALAGDHFQPETSTANFKVLEVRYLLESVFVMEDKISFISEFTFDVSRVRISAVMLP